MSTLTTRAVTAALAAVLALTGLTACGQGGGAPSPQASATGTAGDPPGRATPRFLTRDRSSALDPDAAYAVTATVPDVAVHESPGGAVLDTLANPLPSGAPRTFLLADPATAGEWLEVWVPVRPNGTRGWVRASEVELAEVGYRLEVSTADNELMLLEDGEPVRTFPVATGTGDTPTPLGTFFLTELLEPTNRGYGPYAYGLSGFSEVLSDFGGGPGQIGLHGTEDAGSIGRAASHGCIRLANEDITELAELLPLGTPVVIS